MINHSNLRSEKFGIAYLPPIGSRSILRHLYHKWFCVRFRPKIINDCCVLCTGFMLVLTLQGGHVQVYLIDIHFTINSGQYYLLSHLSEIIAPCSSMLTGDGITNNHSLF